MLRAAAVAVCALAACVRCEDHWAVLVAGSNTFWNYRHQADVCHAYHVLISRGFHQDRIIVMMYDDVANNVQNPFRGQLFNYPWQNLEEAVNVYDGCKIDYRTEDVTPEKFVAVLTGDAKTAGGRVLESTAEDHVFVNFVDHGGVGLIAFPEAAILHASKLIETLQLMHTKGMYKQLTFYLETCESGSMFQDLLPKKLPVYALTAANAKESSWGTFCGAQATVAGRNIGSCLGDLFSVNWMMDSDRTVGTAETMKQQYARVKHRTNKSHVMRFGQRHHIGTEPVSDFQGPEDSMSASQHEENGSPAAAVDARDVKLDALYHAYLKEGTAEAGDRLREEIEARQAVKRLGASLEASVVQSSGEQPMESETFWTAELLNCHERATDMFSATCSWTEGHLPLSKILYKLCVQTAGHAEAVIAGVQGVCSPKRDIVV